MQCYDCRRETERTIDVVRWIVNERKFDTITVHNVRSECPAVTGVSAKLGNLMAAKTHAANCYVEYKQAVDRAEAAQMALNDTTAMELT